MLDRVRQNIDYMVSILAAIANCVFMESPLPNAALLAAKPRFGSHFLPSAGTQPCSREKPLDLLNSHGIVLRLTRRRAAHVKVVRQEDDFVYRLIGKTWLLRCATQTTAPKNRDLVFSVPSRFFLNRFRYFPFLGSWLLFGGSRPSRGIGGCVFHSRGRWAYNRFSRRRGSPGRG